MSWFSLPWSRKADARTIRKPGPRFRPAVEILEERTVPSAVDLFVVPAGTPIDNVTTFATLQAALSAGSLSGTNGSIIQIEPGSSPGNVAGFGSLPNALNLTIQGDPGAGLSATPMFTTSDTSFEPTSAQVGFTFKGVNIGLIQGTSGSSTTNGELDFFTSGTITNSNVVNINSASPHAIFFDGLATGQADVLANSTIAGSAANFLLEVQLAGTSTNNLISGNTFVAQTGAWIDYTASAATTVTDQVIGNTFSDPGNTTAPPLGFLSVSGPISGLTIQGNTLSLSPSGLVAIAVFTSSGSYDVNILGNTINSTGAAGPEGILLQTQGSGTSTANITGNRIQTGSTGLEVILRSTTTLDALVQGNDFHGNKIGVAVLDNGSGGSASGIDLGGGSLNSLGGNNFRGFTAPGSSTSGAIVASSGTPHSTGTIFAKHNLFSVATPSTVTFTNGPTIDPSIDTTDLTGTTAFVETLYIEYLRRAGAASELAGWVNSGLSQSQIANDILRSKESLTNIVDSLYLKILGRQADPGGQAAFVNLLQNGGTIEQATADMVSSPEYAGDTGSDGAFIQSLYNKILGRIGSNAEVQGWLNALPSLGRVAVANDFLFSAEFRGDAVEQLYGDPLAQAASIASLLPDLLHRPSPPSAAEVADWVNSGLDLLSLQAAIAGTGEFFTNG